MSSEPVPLPLDRVTDCVAFEIGGVDLAGPLFLKSEEKAGNSPDLDPIENLWHRLKTLFRMVKTPRCQPQGVYDDLQGVYVSEK
ncbi:hypothetical protein TNCV_5130091 [Trichonephila clavipes]|nr:hypothetical protein TNCV_5130091 [Trichonephila clavipes]